MTARRIPVSSLLMLDNIPAGMNPLVLMSLAYMFRSTTQDAAPILVRPEGDLYRVLDGRHRAVASVIAGRPDVPCILEES